MSVCMSVSAGPPSRANVCTTSAVPSGAMSVSIPLMYPVLGSARSGPKEPPAGRTRTHAVISRYLGNCRSRVHATTAAPSSPSAADTSAGKSPGASSMLIGTRAPPASTSSAPSYSMWSTSNTSPRRFASDDSGDELNPSGVVVAAGKVSRRAPGPLPHSVNAPPCAAAASGSKG